MQQNKLTSKKVVIIGLGALGSRTTQLLVKSGFLNLILIDRDLVEKKNLERQNYVESEIGKPKVYTTADKLKIINNQINLQVYFDNLDFTNAEELLKNADLILDCTDNLETRFLINDFCVKNSIPFIYSAAVADSGYVFFVNPKDGACLKCLLGNAYTNETCETLGLLNETSQAIAKLQVSEAINFLTNGEFRKELIYFNLKKGIQKFNVNKRQYCEVCKGKFEFLEGKKTSKMALLCGNSYLIRGNFEFGKVKDNLTKIGDGNVKDFGNTLLFNNLTIFQDGRVLVKAVDEKKAVSLYSRFIGN